MWDANEDADGYDLNAARVTRRAVARGSIGSVKLSIAARLLGVESNWVVRGEGRGGPAGKTPAP